MGLLNGNLTGLGLLDRNTVGQIATGEFLGNARNVGDAEQRMAAQNYNDAVNSGVTGSALQSLQTTMGQAAQKNSYTQRGVDMVSTLNPTNAGFQRANGELVSAPTTREFGAWDTVPSMALNTFGGQNFGAAASFNPDSNNRSVNFSPTAMRETAEAAYRTGPGILDFDQEAIARAFNDTYAHEFTHAGSDLTDKFGERSAKADHGFMDSVAKGMKADTLSDPRSRDLTGFNVEAAPAQTLNQPSVDTFGAFNQPSVDTYGALSSLPQTDLSVGPLGGLNQVLNSGQMGSMNMSPTVNTNVNGMMVDQFNGLSVTDPSQVANQVARQAPQGGSLWSLPGQQTPQENADAQGRQQAAEAAAAAASAAQAASWSASGNSGYGGNNAGGYTSSTSNTGNTGFSGGTASASDFGGGNSYSSDF